MCLGGRQADGIQIQRLKAFYSLRNRERESKRTLTKREFDGELLSPIYNPDTGALAGDFKWTVDIRKAKKKFVSVSATYFIIYRNIPKVEGEHAKAFLLRVGRFCNVPLFQSPSCPAKCGSKR
jgi:hypothetical protein